MFGCVARHGRHAAARKPHISGYVEHGTENLLLLVCPHLEQITSLLHPALGGVAHSTVAFVVKNVSVGRRRLEHDDLANRLAFMQ